MKAPPTIPDQPAATADDPVIAGVTILSSRDCGSSNRWEFSINRGEEETAINALLDLLHEFSEFSLADRSRGDCELYVYYRSDGAAFKTMIGGHGWSGEWKTQSREWVVYEADKQVKFNDSRARHNCGHLIKEK